MNLSTQLPPHLTDKQASELLSQHGPNELPKAEKLNIWSRLSKLLREPMLLLLVVVSGLYLLMGDLGEGIMLGLSAFVVIGISYYQERKSERALEALKELSSPRALVIRNGVEKRIASCEVVPGDLVALYEGDRVPADGIVLRASNLNIDESLLTGESFPVRKQIYSDPSQKDAEIQSSFRAFSNTLVISGSGLICITHTGAKTEVGKIGQSLQTAAPEELSLSKEIRQIVKLFAWSGGVVCIAIVLLYGISHKDWIQAFLIGLATQMALLPEEFPVVLTIFLAMGAWRLSKVQVLVRKPNAIERLGAVTVLCVDKTGTLTLNQMSVAGIHNGKDFISMDQKSKDHLPEEFHEVAEFAVLASHRDPFDPMEKAIRKMLEEGRWGKDHLHQDWQFERDYPLSDKLLAMSCVWKAPNQHSHVIASKGAPEAIIDLCHLSDVQKEAILQATTSMAKKGLRVLGVARASFSSDPLPSNQHDFDFEWLGLIGLEDPLRTEVPAAVEKCRRAGIRVVMMTGDYPETALIIGERAGLEVTNSLITGADLKNFSDQELKERLQTAHIFARMVPEQKLRVVKLLKEMNHIVAMTGDGVNDAPSIKWADIGIAMGARGTDVAREASDIVLLDDNFTSIVKGIERGRVIFRNIKKAMSYIVSIHVPIAGLSILPVIFNWPLILTPIHIVFLELIIDPACSLMFEAQEAEDGVMNSSPRSLEHRLFGLRELVRSMLQGLFILAVTLGGLWFERAFFGGGAEKARALAFVVLTLSNLGLIFADMSEGSWRSLKSVFQKTSNIVVILSLLAVLSFLTQIESVSSLFKFKTLSWSELGIGLLIALMTFIILSFWNRISILSKRG